MPSATRFPDTRSAAWATALASAVLPGVGPPAGRTEVTGVPYWIASAIASIVAMSSGGAGTPSCTRVTAASVSGWVCHSSAARRISSGSRPLIRIRREARSSQALFSAPTTAWWAAGNSGVPAARSILARAR